MRNHERRIYFVLLNTLKQAWHVFVHVSLTHSQCEAFREGNAKWHFVDDPAIHSGNGKHAAFAAGAIACRKT